MIVGAVDMSRKTTSRWLWRENINVNNHNHDTLGLHLFAGTNFSGFWK